VRDYRAVPISRADYWAEVVAARKANVAFSHPSASMVSRIASSSLRTRSSMRAFRRRPEVLFDILAAPGLAEEPVRLLDALLPITPVLGPCSAPLRQPRFRAHSFQGRRVSSHSRAWVAELVQQFRRIVCRTLVDDDRPRDRRRAG
jgi:hypothetical protein